MLVYLCPHLKYTVSVIFVHASIIRSVYHCACQCMLVYCYCYCFFNFVVDLLSCTVEMRALENGICLTPSSSRAGNFQASLYLQRAHTRPVQTSPSCFFFFLQRRGCSWARCSASSGASRTGWWWPFPGRTEASLSGLSSAPSSSVPLATSLGMCLHTQHFFLLIKETYCDIFAVTFPTPFF